MKIYAFSLVFLFIACGGSENNIPKGLIAKEKLVSLYVDIHLSDALVTEMKLKEVNISNQFKKVYLASVLEKHEISLEDFEKTNAYYESNPQLMFKVYEEVLIEMSKLEADTEGEKVTLEDRKKKAQEKKEKIKDNE